MVPFVRRALGACPQSANLCFTDCKSVIMRKSCACKTTLREVPQESIIPTARFSAVEDLTQEESTMRAPEESSTLAAVSVELEAWRKHHHPKEDQKTQKKKQDSEEAEPRSSQTTTKRSSSPKRASRGRQTRYGCNARTT